MKDTDFDHLCAGATPEETKRLRKLLTEWARGAEDAFPVQLALLTRAQWRSAATVPRLVENERRALEETMARAKAEFAASAQALQDALRTGVTQLQLEVTRQSTGIKNVAATINVHLGTANAVAHDIRESLAEGRKVLDRAKESFASECRLLQEMNRDLRNHSEKDTWVALCLALLFAIIVGVGIGLYLSHRVEVPRASPTSEPAR
ncbi:MAG: hypothetical protein AB7O66_25925 [Limisphaerales bacterium]